MPGAPHRKTAAETAPMPLEPLALNGPRLSGSKKNSPPTATSSSGANFSTVETSWTAPTQRVPAKLASAGSHWMTRAARQAVQRWSSTGIRTSRSPTAATASAALDTHVVIQYAQAARNPAKSPKAPRA